VRWTLSDINRFQDQVNYRMIDREFFSVPRPKFRPLDLDLALKNLDTHLDVQGATRLRKFWTWLTDKRAFDRGNKRTLVLSRAIMQRFFLYIDCWEFVDNMEIQDDFHVNHSISNMHVWLLYQRLRDFSENKFAFDLKEEIIEAFNEFTREQMAEVDVLRKNKKLEDIENYLFAIRRNFDFHFFINGKTSENPYYKIDALVWSSIFHEKVPRYSDLVYKMSEYFIQHYYYLKTLSFAELEQCVIDWSAYRIPLNFKAKTLKYNPPMTEEEFVREY